MKKIFSNKTMLKNKAAILIFFLALLVRIFFIFGVSHVPLENDADEYNTLGIFLSQGKGYVNDLGEPTASRPPIYPLFLASIYYIAGHNLLLVRLIQAFMGAGICVFVYLIATKIFNKRIGILSGVVCSLYLPLVVNVSQIMTETFFTFLLLLGIWLIIYSDRLFYLMLSGLVFGLALLTRSFIIFFFPFLIYWLLLHGRYKFLKGIPILIIGVLIVLTPWTIRNYSKLNAFVPLSNIGGLALYNSYIIPEKGFGFNSLQSLDDEYLKIHNETDKNEYLVRKSIEFIKENPVKVIQLAAIKVLLFIYPFDGYWYPVSFGSKYNIFWGLVLSFSAIGIVIHFRDKNAAKNLLLYVFISFLAGVMLFYGSPRFRLPIEPLLICFAASAFFPPNNRLNFSFFVMLINVTFFIIFRYFELKSMFDLLRSNI